MNCGLVATAFSADPGAYEANPTRGTEGRAARWIRYRDRKGMVLRRDPLYKFSNKSAIPPMTTPKLTYQQFTLTPPPPRQYNALMTRGGAVW